MNFDLQIRRVRNFIDCISMLIVMMNLKLHITQDLLCVMIILNHGVSSPLTAPKKGIA
ncbi:hypothetical protein J5U22_00123 [Saccharolobus shibatae]|uniref:Uncharacterized protein n=1 Tax=Saccharolobus shibatae TaxID=2286 RepID=A0A8F5GXU8_9CREN|nr:hypothetical protein J5U22_00123 [Saccharolobus shibatae]